MPQKMRVSNYREYSKFLEKKRKYFSLWHKNENSSEKQRSRAFIYQNNGHARDFAWMCDTI